MRLLIPLALACVAFGAQAQPANKRAEAEARSYLLPCPSGAAGCVQDQRHFVDSYILAKAGEAYFIGDLVGFLDPPHAPIAIKPDRLKACAWRYIHWKLDDDTPKIADIYRRDWKAHCVGQPDVDEAKQKTIILALIADLKNAPTVLTPQLAAIRDHYAPLEPIAAALVATTLPPE